VIGTVPPTSRRSPRTAPVLLFAAAGAALLGCSVPAAEPAPASAPAPGQVILQELRSFREFGSVLYVAAHPDDENTQLITYLARGRDYRTAYLSLTRGDGGQNVLGPEFGDLLGVIRTQELLAARRVDGGRQFFSRARDFGYSKDYRDTLTKWDHQQVLSDIVRVIRVFRPDIIITRFPPQPSNTHGHHTASADLAVEAFKPRRRPEGISGAAWRAHAMAAPADPVERLWSQSRRRPARPWRAADRNRRHRSGDGGVLRVIAARSRSMHRTQGFANFSVASGGSGPRIESFQVLGGAPAEKDIMDGVDTTWGRVRGGEEVGRLAGEIIGKFDAADPAASVPALLALRARLSALAADPVVDEKRRLLDRILQACLGLSVETWSPNPRFVPGEALKMRHTAIVRSAVPVRWAAVRYPGIGREADRAIELRPNETAVRDGHPDAPGGHAAQPALLAARGRHPRHVPGGRSGADRPAGEPAGGPDRGRLHGGRPDAGRRGRGRAGHGRPCERRGPEAPRRDPARLPELPRPWTCLRPARAARWPSRSSRRGSARPERFGSRLPPAGIPRRQRRRSASRHRGTAPSSRFTVTAPASPAAGPIRARADVDGVSYGNERIEINYSHIPPQLLQPPARLKAVSLELAVRGHERRLSPGRRRQRRRKPGADGLCGHPAHGRRSHRRKAQGP
jgi:LmbE family N-acetylglucosaminyl deacetylase